MKILSVFAHHKVAANLLMLIMLLSGIFALSRLNVQFFPTFELDRISVRVIWSGASAEDIEQGITIPLEQSLKTVENVKHMTSTSAQDVSPIQLEFFENTDMILALDKVKQKVDEFRNLPLDAEKPQVENLTRYEGVAKLILSGGHNGGPELDMHELRMLANQFERKLIKRGIDKVEINGLPDEEISIEIPLIFICVIMVSLVESFFVLPGHLRHAFSHFKQDDRSHRPAHLTIRNRLDDAFDKFRQNRFRSLITWSLSHRAVIIALNS